MPERVYITYENSLFGNISGVYRDLEYAKSESRKRGELSHVDYQDIIEVPHDGLLDYGVSIAFYYNHNNIIIENNNDELTVLLDPFFKVGANYCVGVEELEHFVLNGNSQILIVYEKSLMMNNNFLSSNFISALEKIKKKVIVISEMKLDEDKWYPKNISNDLINNTKTIFSLNSYANKESYILYKHPLKQPSTTPILTKESLTDSATFKDLLKPKGEESNE